MSAPAPRRLRPSVRRRGATAALLSVAAALASTAPLPEPVRAPLGFLLFAVMPGWLMAESLLRSADSTPEERAMASLALSIPIAAAGRSLAFAAGLSPPALPWAWAGLCSIWALLLPPRPGGSARADPVAWLAAGALALVVALPAALNPVLRVHGDAMVHAQFVEEIRLRGIPPQDPSFAGMPLMYMWSFHVWIAALVEAMGVSPYRVFPWVGGAMIATLTFGAYRFASLLWTGRPARRFALLAPLGMNALGWVWLATQVLVVPLVGETRDPAEVERRLSLWLLQPNANAACGALIYRSYFILCSLLYKFMCANALATSLALGVATLVLAGVCLGARDRGRLVALALVALSAAAIHPLVGVPGTIATITGLILAARAPGGRGAAVRPLGAVLAGLVLASCVIAYMLRVGIAGGARAQPGPVITNLWPLAQGLSVVLLPALWGWWRARRRTHALAALALGHGLAAFAFALAVDLPQRGEAYLVYGAYLGVALCAGEGVAAAASALARRVGRAATAVLVGLVFLPNALILFNALARQGPAWGLAGYPETDDEIAVFDHIRERVPLDAIVIDSQRFYSSSVAAYGGRRGLFGGMTQARLVGYPRGEMAARERVVVNLLLEPAIQEATWRALGDITAPLFVVARRMPPRDVLVDSLPRPTVDAVAKLDSLPTSFRAVRRTATVVLYRFERPP